MTTAIAAARFLARHIPAIAQDEAAAELFADIKAAVESIERVVNRPVPARFLGPCPSLLKDNYGERICSAELTAGREDKTVQCEVCKATHYVEQLHDQQMHNIDVMSFTIDLLFRVILPINREYVPLRTLQHWVASGRLIPTGYEGTDPRFLLADVRELREAKSQKAPTGAAAEKYKRKAG